jgi:hypothetical protein
MLPDYIMHAIIQELPKAQLDRLVRKAGFDPDNLTPPLEHDLPFELSYSGELDFNLTVGAFGACHSVPCRTIWTAELADDPETGKRVRGQIQCKVYKLAPDEDDDRLVWSALDFDLLPRSAFEGMDAQIEAQALRMEFDEKSGS